MELKLNLEYAFVEYNDNDFTKKKGEELRNNNNNNKFDNDNINDDSDILYIKNPQLRIADAEGFHEDDINYETLVPCLEFSVAYNKDELYSFSIQAEKIVILRDMLDSYLKTYEMREKILAKK